VDALGQLGLAPRRVQPEQRQQAVGQEVLQGQADQQCDGRPRQRRALGFVVVWGLISVTARAGAMVMALMAEITVAAAMVRANCL
jgi:hypothetical protein